MIPGITALGDASQDDAKGVAVLTISAILWSFLGAFPFIQVKLAWEFLK